MSNTTYLNLEKPDIDEYYNVNVQNANMDKLDAKAKEVDSHWADTMRYVEYAKTTNIGNVYSVTIPNLTVLKDGLQIRVKFNVASTGAITINPNGLGNKNIVDFFGTSVTNVRLNLIANLAYESTSDSFIFLGKGGDYAIGKQITDLNLAVSTPAGFEIWSNSDVGNCTGVVSDDLGNVYVSSSKPTGKTVRKLNNLGVEIWSNSDVGNCTGIAIDNLGNIYVSSSSTKSVRKLNGITGVEIWNNSTLGNASALVVDGSYNVYVACLSSQGIVKLNSLGTKIWNTGGIHEYANGITIDDLGNVYATFRANNVTRSVSKITSAGVETWYINDVTYGYGISVDKSYSVYVTYYNVSGKTVRKLNSSGAEIWSNTALTMVSAIAIDDLGNIYITSNTTVMKLNNNGDGVWNISSGGSGIRCISVDKNYNVYVTLNASSGKIVRKLTGYNKYTIIN